MKNIIGRIHSLESCGTVDGPGIRFVVFMQGCPLRCQYCHNPDTWKLSNGKEMDTDSLLDEILKYSSYMRFSGGGVTMTGGEPLLQLDFVKEILKGCKENEIHTALDTSGYIFNDNVKDVLDYTDLVLLDVKGYNKDKYKDLTGVALDPTLDFLSYLNTINKPTWVRFVLVPNLTDDEKDLHDLAKFLSTFNNIERLELLPFHKMGEYKWEELGYEYKLKNTDEPTEQGILKAKNIFESYNINVYTNE
ncbi:pyruvate formate lyase activating enzyme [Natranaerovirga hydrolytica]|uniref:Pyruvate formate-lyase-activating enzyme n=1 Tax=Natranaerovirga hydrolytica TaxID=680378 RepID=A0A4R1N1B1_9FIRM|nr:pyruvate formate-lyase-activating protein [Natranaerovirga hydrolytica]TCK99726.1 pyruvate formate lyase activating enzyme [Natranaerovirga hydrolytica]